MPRAFYERPTRAVARDLLGKILVVDDAPGGRRAVRIVEVEAYLGTRDPASHAFRGMTRRTAPMFGPPGRSYVYFVYGMYHCVNVVTERDGVAGAVLIRGAEPLLVARPRARGLRPRALTPRPSRGSFAPPWFVAEARALAGPAKLAQVLGLTTAHTDLDVVRGSPLHIHDAPRIADRQVRRGPRVGLNEGSTMQAPWRYWILGSHGVSPAGGARSVARA